MESRNKLARKIWIGVDLKHSSMSWNVNQKVKIGPGYNAPTGVIEFIVIKEGGSYEIHVLKEKSSFLWKEGNMPFVAEYSTDYE